MSSRAPDVLRARLLVSVAAVAALAATVLLALLVAASLSGRGAAVATAYGVAAAGDVALAAGLLLLARAGAVAPTDPERARVLCTRCTLGALAGVVAVLVAGGVAVLLTRSGVPMRGATVAAALLVGLVGLAARRRAVLLAELYALRRAALRAAAREVAREAAQARMPYVPPPRSGGGRESEPDRVAGAR